jgi:trans-aconitate methyltransferase
MSVATAVLERTLVYRLWQAPFAEQKFAPVLMHNDLQQVRRVLDVACGPGTNTHHFCSSQYLGIDINERYIADAKRRHGRDFVAADVRAHRTAPEERFDFILVNSFLHHLNDQDVASMLAHLQTLLSEDGHIHILELVLPANRSLARLLARWDRGKFARSLQHWETLISQNFDPVTCESYPLAGMGLTLWNMVYFKGRPKR